MSLVEYILTPLLITIECTYICLYLTSLVRRSTQTLPSYLPISNSFLYLNGALNHTLSLSLNLILSLTPMQTTSSQNDAQRLTPLHLFFIDRGKLTRSLFSFNNLPLCLSVPHKFRDERRTQL